MSKLWKLVKDVVVVALMVVAFLVFMAMSCDWADIAGFWWLFGGE